MIERYRYRGHDIRIELISVAPRHVRWAWEIDGVHRAKGRTTGASEEAARSEAFLYAQVMVARLKNQFAVLATSDCYSRPATAECS